MRRLEHRKLVATTTAGRVVASSQAVLSPCGGSWWIGTPVLVHASFTSRSRIPAKQTSARGQTRGPTGAVLRPSTAAPGPGRWSRPVPSVRCPTKSRPFPQSGRGPTPASIPAVRPYGQGRSPSRVLADCGWRQVGEGAGVPDLGWEGCRVIDGVRGLVLVGSWVHADLCDSARMAGSADLVRARRGGGSRTPG